MELLLEYARRNDTGDFEEYAGVRRLCAGAEGASLRVALICTNMQVATLKVLHIVSLTIAGIEWAGARFSETSRNEL